MSKDKEPYQLPEGWVWTKLGDVSITSSGGTPDRKNSSYFAGNIPWVKSGELNYNIITETEESITEEALTFSSAKIFPKGSLLIALYGNTVGRMAFLGVNAATNQAVASIIPFLINPKYLFYYLMFSKEDLLNKREGSAQPNISQKVLNEFLFPLAPTEDQNKIIDKVEELFSELDKSIEDLIKAKRQLEVYRLSLLNDLFTKVLDGKYKEDTLGNLCIKIQDGTHFSPKEQFKNQKENRYLYITSKNIRNNFIDLTNVTYVNEEFYKSVALRCNPKYGDILLTKDGANTGNITINTLQESICLLSSVCLLRPKQDLIVNKYLTYYIQSPLGNKSLIDEMSGTAIKRLVLRQIKKIKIPYPDISAQNRIIGEIELQFTNIDHAKKIIEADIVRIRLLKQSILKQAFEGKLTKQNKMESASDLLRKITAEKEKYFLAEKLNRQTIKKPKMEPEKKTIIDVLKEKQPPVLAKELWESSIYQGDIEAFYAELKRLIESGEVQELPREGKESFITLKK